MGYYYIPYPTDDPYADEVIPICPECEEECGTIYMVDDRIFGCEHCVTIQDAVEVEDCFPQR